MTGPAWLAPVLAAVMLLIAGGSIARLAFWWLRGRAAEPEADALHAVMGVAMAAMLEPRTRAVPDTVWMAVFAAATAWFGVRAICAQRRERDSGNWRGHPGDWRCAHPAPHSVECVAMIYMLMPARAAGHRPAMAMPGMTGAAQTANPAVVVLLALFMLGYILWTADRMTSQPRPRVADAVLAPRAAACSKIAMSVAMGYMLLTML